jgi:hypothetical protein
VSAGVTGSALYDGTMYILAGMLALGFVANVLVRPLAERWYMRDEDVAALGDKAAATAAGPSGSFGIGRGGLDVKSGLAWLAVGLPLAWGIWITLANALVLFR